MCSFKIASERLRVSSTKAASASLRGTSCISSTGWIRGRISATRRSSVGWERLTGRSVGEKGGESGCFSGNGKQAVSSVLVPGKLPPPVRQRQAATAPGMVQSAGSMRKSGPRACPSLVAMVMRILFITENRVIRLFWKGLYSLKLRFFGGGARRIGPIGRINDRPAHTSN